MDLSGVNSRASSSREQLIDLVCEMICDMVDHVSEIGLPLISSRLFE
jgi:hypothetical protein